MDVSCIDLLPYQHDAVFRSARFTWNCWARQTREFHVHVATAGVQATRY